MVVNNRSTDAMVAMHRRSLFGAHSGQSGQCKVHSGQSKQCKVHSVQSEQCTVDSAQFTLVKVHCVHCNVVSVYFGAQLQSTAEEQWSTGHLGSKPILTLQSHWCQPSAVTFFKLLFRNRALLLPLHWAQLFHKPHLKKVRVYLGIGRKAFGPPFAAVSGITSFLSKMRTFFEQLF